MDAREEEAEVQRRMFVLQVVQPGLAGLMDGSVSTLAPLFAAAFATHHTWETFLVGIAAASGAFIEVPVMRKSKWFTGRFSLRGVYVLGCVIYASVFFAWKSFSSAWRMSM